MTEQKTNTLENFLTVVEGNLATTLAAKAAALPDGFQAAKFQQNCVAMLKGIKKQDLMNIKPEDVVACLMKGALLDLDFQSGECYAIPYWNKEEGKNDLNFQTDYKGEDKIAKTYSIKPVFNTIKEVVREGDEYQKFVEGGNVYFKFVPKPFNTAPIIGAFAQVQFADGSSIGEEMGKDELEELRKNFSKAPNSPAWTKRTGEMYKKTVLRLVLKNVAKSFKNSAQQIAYSTASDFEFNNSVGTSNNSEKITNVFANQLPVNNTAAIEQKNDFQPIEMPQNEFSEEEVPVVASETENSTQSIPAASEIENYYECANCGTEISAAEDGFSRRNYGKPLCRSCQALAKNGEL